MTRSPRALALPLSLALALALLAAPAGALGVHDGTISFDDLGIQGSVEILDVVTGLPAEGFVRYGGVGASDTTIVMRGHLDAGSDSVFGFASAVVDGTTGVERPFSGLGWVTGTAGFPISDAFPVPGRPETAGFTGPFFAGDTTVPYFVSYAGDLRAGDALFAGAGGSDSALGSTALVPEPTGLVLALAGLGLVYGRIRRLG